MSKQYYTLRWDGGKEHLAAAENPVRLGQKADCDVRLPNNGPYEDETFALIRPDVAKDGWVLLPSTENVQTLVNGAPVQLVHYLRTGDRISFSETDAEIIFELRSGERFGTETVRFTSLSRKVIAIAACAALLLAGLGIYALRSAQLQEKRNGLALENAKESIYRIRVDSLYYTVSVAGEKTICESIPSNEENGTAFVTESGLLITARHCIEPWLNTDERKLYEEAFESWPADVAMAARAETYNQLHPGDTVHRLVSRCSILKGDGTLVRVVYSDDFRYDSSRDEVIEIGDFNSVHYRRSITGRFNRADMMLGDIACLDALPLKGTLKPANEELLRHWSKPHTVLGYPSRHIQAGLETPDITPLAGYQPGLMITYQESLVPGYSGGPAVFVKNGDVYVVGVVSTVDPDDSPGNKGKERSFFVPITELPL